MIPAHYPRTRAGFWRYLADQFARPVSQRAGTHYGSLSHGLCMAMDEVFFILYPERHEDFGGDWRSAAAELATVRAEETVAGTWFWWPRHTARGRFERALFCDLLATMIESGDL